LWASFSRNITVISQSILKCQYVVHFISKHITLRHISIIYFFIFYFFGNFTFCRKYFGIFYRRL